MAEYEMQEMNLPNKEGKRVLYPRLVQRGQADTDYIAKTLAQDGTREIGKIGRNRHFRSFTGFTRRQGTGNRRRRQHPPKCTEHRSRKHQLPCRKRTFTQYQLQLRTGTLATKIPPVIAKVQPRTTVGKGTTVSYPASLYDGK